MRNFAFESIILRIWKKQRNSFVNLLLARNVDYNYLRLYSLDRIEGVNLTDANFVLPKDFCAKEYFAEYFGIVLDESVPLQRIVLRQTNAISTICAHCRCITRKEKSSHVMIMPILNWHCVLPMTSI